MRPALLLGLGYVALGIATVRLSRFDGGVAFIWIASALLLARLAMLPRERWGWSLVACGLASLLVSATVGAGIAAGPLMAATNLAEAAGGAWLLQRANPDRWYLDSIGGVSSFVIVAGVLMPLLTALVGGTTVSLVTGMPYGANLLHWFSAHALGALALTPVFSISFRALRDRAPRRLAWGAVAEGAAWLLAVAAVTAGVFVQHTRPILFLPLLPMMAATVRTGPLGAAGSTTILALLGGVLTLRGAGPVNLIHGSVGDRALFFQGYVACAALLVLPVAALLRQRDALLDRVGESEARYRLIAEHLPDAILDVAADGTVRYASPAVTRLLGRSPESLVGEPARHLVRDEDVLRLRRIGAQARARGEAAYTLDYWVPGPDGGPRWFEATVRFLPGDAGAISTLRDITDRKAAESRLAAAANTDALTGLANRRAFMAMLEQRLRERRENAAPLTLAMFDLDHFKAVNDRHGHAAGDAVLEAVATTARATLRDADCVARIGGEEFAILFRDTIPADALAAGERLRRAIRALRVPLGEGVVLTVTASIGVAPALAGHDAGTLLQAADEALYAAKRAGRDCLKVA